METIADKLIGFPIAYGLKIIGAIIILIFGRVAAAIGRKAATRVLTKQDPSVVSFAGSFAYILFLALTVLAALAKFGFQTASPVAPLGAAGLAVGFTLQGSLANSAAGVLILVLCPYKLSDFIGVAGVARIVKEASLFTTELAILDNGKILVRNSKMYGTYSRISRPMTPGGWML